jgi:diaminopimelate epimerase
MDAYFYKYQALGNDMVVIDPATCAIDLTPTAVRLVCDRHRGVGADGICYGPLPDQPHRHTMRFFNPDGSEAEKSGNGLRIFARYLWDAGYVNGRTFSVVVNNEHIAVQVVDETAATIVLSMGHLTFDSRTVPVAGPRRDVVAERMVFAGKAYEVTAVSIGNPHCVIFTAEPDAAHRLGPVIETAPAFPKRTNVQFAQVIDGRTIQIEIWERGAGYTLASGTSACAAAGAAVKTGRCQSPVEVRMAGGVAQVAIDEAWHVTLTGAVTAVYQGAFAADFLEQLNPFC